MQRLSLAPRSASCPVSALLRVGSNNGLLTPHTTTSPPSSIASALSRRSRCTIAWKKHNKKKGREYIEKQIHEHLVFEQTAAGKQHEIEKPLEDERKRELTANNPPDAVAPFWDTTRPKRNDADPGEPLRFNKWHVNPERHNKDAGEGGMPSNRKNSAYAPKGHDTDPDAVEGLRFRRNFVDPPKALHVEVDRPAWRKVVRQEVAAPSKPTTGDAAHDEIVALARWTRKERLAATKNKTSTYVHLSNLPADCTRGNVMEALVAAAPIGRVMAMTFTPPTPRHPDNALASIEFNTVIEAERLYRSKMEGKFLVKGVRPYVTLQPKTNADHDRLDGPQYVGFPPSRVLFIRGLRSNPAMNVDKIRELLEFNDVDAEAESVQINRTGNTITILWKFLCWRYGARRAMTVLRANTTVGVWYGLDPCEYAPGTLTGWKELLAQQSVLGEPTNNPEEHEGGKPQQHILDVALKYPHMR